MNATLLFEFTLSSQRHDNSKIELEGAWRLLDPGGVGSFPAAKLKELVLKAGIRLDIIEVSYRDRKSTQH